MVYSFALFRLMAGDLPGRIPSAVKSISTNITSARPQTATAVQPIAAAGASPAQAGDWPQLGLWGLAMGVLLYGLGFITAVREAEAEEIRAGSQAELQEAFKNAASGDTIVLDSNINITSGLNVSSGNKYVSIDGNGFVLDGGGKGYIYGFPRHMGQITNITFQNGKTGDGGGGFIFGSLTAPDSSADALSNSNFYNNTSSLYGGAVTIATGGQDGKVIGNVRSNNWVGNKTSGAGGALAIGVGGMYGDLINNTFTDNTAGNYAGAFGINGSLYGNAVDSNFERNTAANYGGAIGFSGKMIGNILGTVFVDNVSKNQYGGAVGIAGVMTGDIVDSRFSGNSSGTFGGAVGVYGNILDGVIKNSVFENNTAATYGGAIGLRGDLSGGIDGSTFTGNSATRESGGALYLTGSLKGGINNSEFTGNTALASGKTGGAVSVVKDLTDGISASSFNRNKAAGHGGAIYIGGNQSGGISGSTFEGNESTAGSGGGLYLAGTFQGGLTDSVFRNNQAKLSGGALYFAKSFEGGISGSNFEDNYSAANGGAAYFAAGLGGGITNSQFLNNSSDGLGGALYLNTTTAWASPELSLQADLGRQTIFSGNSDKYGANSIYIGYGGSGSSQVSPVLSITGQGAVALMDPLRVELNNNKSFTLNREDESGLGLFIWGGENTLSTTGSGSSSIGLLSGLSQVLKNFTVKNIQGVMNLAFGGGHTLGLNLVGRDPNQAMFDFTGNSKGQLTIAPNTVIKAGRSASAYSGRYLMIDGYALTEEELANFVLENVPGKVQMKLEYDPDSKKLWLVVEYTPDGSGGTTDPDPENPDPGTDPEPENPDPGTDPEPENPDPGTDPEPENPDPGTDPEPENPDPGTDPEPENPDPGTDPDPENPDPGTDPEPENPDPGIDPEPENPDPGTDPDPENPDPGTDPDPENPDPGTDPEPENPDPGTDPDPENPDPGTDPEPENPDPGTDPEPENPDPGTDPEPENPDPGIDPEPENPEPGTDPEPENPDPGTDPEPENPDPGTDPEPEPGPNPNPDGGGESSIGGSLLGGGPNAQLSHEALGEWIEDSLGGLLMTDEQFDQFLKDIDTTTPEAGITMAQVGRQIHFQVLKTALANALNNTKGGASQAAPAAGNKNGGQNSFWSSYIGSVSRTYSQGGYSGYEFNTNGLVFGWTRDLDSNWSLGAYTGFTKSETSFTDMRAKADSDGLHFGLLGSYTADWGGRLTLDGSWSHLKHETSRNPAKTGRTTGKFSQDVYSLGLEMAYDFHPWENGTLSPYFSVRQHWFKQGAYLEKGGNWPYKVEGFKGHGAAATLGANLSHDFTNKKGEKLFTGAVGLGWKHEFGRRQLETGTRLKVPTLSGGDKTHRYKMKSVPQGRDSLVANVGLEKVLKETQNGGSLSFKAGYEMDLSKKTKEHKAMVGFEFRF